MLKLIRQFKVVGDIRNITKASEIIGISQPTLTQNISRLEKTLGVTLLTRNKNGIKLTDAGMTLYINSIDTINSYEKLISSVTGLAENKRQICTIGCGFNWTHTHIFDSIKAVTTQHSEITFNIKNDDTVKLQEELLLNSCDIAMGTIPERLVQHKEIAYLPVFYTHFLVFVAQDHPLLNQETVDNNDLANYQWITVRYANEPEINDRVYASIMPLDTIQFNCQSVTAALKLAQDSNRLIFLSNLFEETAKEYGLVPLPSSLTYKTLPVGVMYLTKNKLAEKLATEIIDHINSQH